jgi:FlgD Ig-like domain
MRRLDIASIHMVLAITLLLAGVVPRPASAAWPAGGRALCTAPGDQLGPAITTDGAGGAIVTWHDRRAFPFNIDALHVLASGEVDAAWPTNGRALLTDALARTIVPAGTEFPVIASDGAGGAIVCWQDGRSTVNGQDIYAHHVLASGMLDPAWPVNGVTVCSVAGEQGAPVIVSDRAGGAFIAWIDGRANDVSSGDVFAAHVLATGVVDPTWPANGVAVCTAPKPQFSLDIVRDEVGGVIVTWMDARVGNPGDDIFAEHVLRTGVVDPAWPANGRALSAAPGTQATPRIISDGVLTAGGAGAIVTWTDLRDGNNDVYAQRVLSSGAIATGWAINGQPVSITGSDEVSPKIVSDGATGAIIAWADTRSGSRNTRANHLLTTGALDPAWPANGVTLSISNLDEVGQVIASDGAGGAIVAWDREFDIFAQHVLASGALDPAYPPQGLSVSSFPHEQHEPDIVAAGVGGAIVTWEDNRDGLEDIYAFQVLASGAVGVTDPPASGGIAFARPSPNPARESIALRFALPRESSVRLAIYDTSGRQVRELASGTQSAGPHAVTWDLHDEGGRAVGAGLYFARLDAGGQTLVQKLTTMK